MLVMRTDHVERLADLLRGEGLDPVVLRGGMSAKDRKQASTALNVADDDERLILATGRYIGEGFDDAALQHAGTERQAQPVAFAGEEDERESDHHREAGSQRDRLSGRISLARELHEHVVDDEERHRREHEDDAAAVFGCTGQGWDPVREASGRQA